MFANRDFLYTVTLLGCSASMRLQMQIGYSKPSAEYRLQAHDRAQWPVYVTYLWT